MIDRIESLPKIRIYKRFDLMKELSYNDNLKVECRKIYHVGNHADVGQQGYKSQHKLISYNTPKYFSYKAS